MTRENAGDRAMLPGGGPRRALVGLLLAGLLCGETAAQERTLASRDLDMFSRIEASTRFYADKCDTAGGAAYWRDGRHRIVDPDIVRKAGGIQAACRGEAEALMQELARRDQVGVQRVRDIFAGKLATDGKLVEKRYGFVIQNYMEANDQANDSAAAVAFACQLFLDRVEKQAGICR